MKSRLSTWITAMSFLVTLAMPVWLVAQKQLERHAKEHTRYT